MLRHLAKVARFLGIIPQELNDLVQEHHVLTSDEPRILRAQIVPTILPGSQDLKNLLPTLRDEGEIIKNNFICKAARSSRGNGHLLRNEISKQEWGVVLLGMQDPRILAEGINYVLQPYVRQPKFDIAVEKDRTVCGSQMVGTYYTANGRYAGLGLWRTGGKSCNVNNGDA
ncbi:hypothetical protein N7522_010964 [Penicillium canescens]|nr:hypothetical protein N7522_010964 [Penicillium canescens]